MAPNGTWLTSLWLQDGVVFTFMPWPHIPKSSPSKYRRVALNQSISSSHHILALLFQFPETTGRCVSTALLIQPVLKKLVSRLRSPLLDVPSVTQRQRLRKGLGCLPSFWPRHDPPLRARVPSQMPLSFAGSNIKEQGSLLMKSMKTHPPGHRAGERLVQMVILNSTTVKTDL